MGFICYILVNFFKWDDEKMQNYLISTAEAIPCQKKTNQIRVETRERPWHQPVAVAPRQFCSHI
jgi:hypothetical protein